MEYCTQCENHCPENELRCGRGRRYFEAEDSADMAVRHDGSHEHGRRHEHEEEGRRHGHDGGDRGHGHDGGDRGHGHRYGHEEGGRRRDPAERKRFTAEEIEAMEEPAELIRACGHELFHRRGREGRMGRAFGDTQRIVLGMLQEAKDEGKDSLSQSELLDRLHIQPGSLSEILRKLEDKGAVRRFQDPDDFRRMSVSLAEGFDWQKAIPDAEQEERKLSMEALTQEEKATLLALLKKLLLSWQKQ